MRDTTTTPPTELPIDELDLSVQQFSTELLHEPNPFAFQLAVRGGDLDLPRRVHRSSALVGLLGAATHAAIGGRDQHDLEPRPLFADLTATGRLQLYPLPKEPNTAPSPPALLTLAVGTWRHRQLTRTEPVSRIRS